MLCSVDGKFFYQFTGRIIKDDCDIMVMALDEYKKPFVLTKIDMMDIAKTMMEKHKCENKKTVIAGGMTFEIVLDTVYSSSFQADLANAILIRIVENTNKVLLYEAFYDSHDILTKILQMISIHFK